MRRLLRLAAFLAPLTPGIATAQMPNPALYSPGAVGGTGGGMALDASNATNPTAGNNLIAGLNFTGVMKMNGSGNPTVAANGTDITLVTTTTCGAGQHVFTITALGAITCTADAAAALTITDGTNSVSGTTTINFGPGFLVGGSTPSPTVNFTNTLNTQSGTGAYAILSTDAAKTILRTNASGGADTIANATGSFGAGYGTVYATTAFAGNTITPTTATINGLTVLKLGSYQYVGIDSDGTNYHAALGLPQPATQTGANTLADDMTWKPAAFLNVAQSFTKPQRTNTTTPTISSTTFTPDFTAGQNIRIAFPATTCSCTIANPASIVAGQSGMFELVQGGTSASLNPTWGSEYAYAGGTSTITLTTTLSGVDYIPYYVDSTGTTIVLGGIVLKPVH